jgi:hypothetical protein
MGAVLLSTDANGGRGSSGVVLCLLTAGAFHKAEVRWSRRKWVCIILFTTFSVIKIAK